MTTSGENACLVADVETKLPVKISKEVQENSPQFLHLLTKVAEKLDKTGRTQKSQRKLDGCKGKTDIARRKFLDSSIKLETLNEVIFSKFINHFFSQSNLHQILSESEINNLSLPGASHETALVNKLRENLTLAEVVLILRNHLLTLTIFRCLACLI